MRVRLKKSRLARSDRSLVFIPEGSQGTISDRGVFPVHGVTASQLNGPNGSLEPGLARVEVIWDAVVLNDDGAAEGPLTATEWSMEIPLDVIEFLELTEVASTGTSVKGPPGIDITISCKNDAFAGFPELGIIRVLADLANKLQRDRLLLTSLIPLTDVNGELCGHARIHFS